MAQKAKCPFCGGAHYTQKAFNKCKKTKAKYVWTKDGKRVIK